MNIELKGGVVKEFEAGATPADIAKSIGMGLYKSVCAAKVNGAVWSARSADDSVIPAGKTVTVKAIEGVKLIVE